MPDEKTIKLPVDFYPFPDWKGPRLAVKSSINSDLWFARFFLPIPKTKDDWATLYNQSLVERDSRAVRSIQYTCDGNGKTDGKIKHVINTELKKRDCDLDQLAEDGFCPVDSFWFIKRNETTKTILAETGWTQAELLEFAKKNPKNK